MRSVISICIPTCNRRDLLELAITSCFDQDYRPLEILIGDDSSGDDTRLWIESLAVPEGVSLRYALNRPALGQAGNVNRLFDRAQGSRLLLLHDDDLLCPHGLDRLAAAWDQATAPACVYGRQTVIDADGTVLDAATQAWNDRYFRLPRLAGAQASALVAALQQQVPNNCYLIETALARAVRYRREDDVGQCVDAEFVVRVALAVGGGAFVFVDHPISAYRLTTASIARSKSLNRRQDLFFEIVQGVAGGPEVAEARSILLSRISVGAALDAAMARRRSVALRIIFSPLYERPLLSRWTAYRLLCAFWPNLGARIKRTIDRQQRSTPHS